MKRIAVVGTFCAGKTTLTNDLGAALSPSTVVPDECRPVLTVLPDVDWTLPELRAYLVVRQVIIEHLVNRDDGWMIVDGGVINNVGHDKALLASPPNRRSLLNHLRHEPYDQVFWCDYSEIRLIDDGQRYLDEDLRGAIDVEIGELLASSGANYSRVRGTPTERLHYALDSLAST